MMRGVMQQQEMFKTFLQTQMWAWKRTNLKTKKEEITMVQGALRECGFVWEYVFPKEHLAEVLTMLHSRDRHQFGAIKSITLRKMLGHGVKKVPEYTDTYNMYVVMDGKPVLFPRFLPMEAVAIYPIGIKDDNVNDCELSGYRQEML